MIVFILQCRDFFKHSNVFVCLFVCFLEKGRKLNRQKGFKQEHCFVQNFNMSDSKGSKKRKGMFSTFELCFKGAFESFLSFVLL